MSNGKTKIAIVSYSLGTGGAERFAGSLSTMLESIDYEVHHIIVNNVVDYSFSGKLYNLGALCEHSFLGLQKMKKGLLLKKYLELEGISIVIDNRTRNSCLRDWCTNLIYGKRKVYFMIHSFYLQNYLPKSVFLASKLYQKAARIICVSKSIEEQVNQKYGLMNTITIYNPIKSIIVEAPIKIAVPEKYMLFYGRLEDAVKNFGLLLNAFFQSKVYEQGIHLVIMGDGSSKARIYELITELKLENYVTMIPFQKDPFAWVKLAKYTILTSNYEGFPMSVIESLSLGTPVVSVDCNSGPREVIVNEHNGLLVENHNIIALSKAIKRMVDDTKLYQFCKENTIGSVSHLTYEKVAAQWKEILEKY